MNITSCLNSFQSPNALFVHPKYLIKNTPLNTQTCATPPYVSSNGKIYIFGKKGETQPSSKPFDIKVFLAAVYKIHTVEDAIKWARDNIHHSSPDTVDRVLDLVWDSLVTKEIIDDPEAFDKLVEMYKSYLDRHNIPNKNIRDVLQAVADKYIGQDLTFHSKKSYQKIIKKNL